MLEKAAALFSEMPSADLAATLRRLAADARLDAMPAKFRLAMEAAADRLQDCGCGDRLERY